MTKVAVSQTKWPKSFPPLTAEQQQISNDFMKYWHEALPRKYGAIEKFNHRYAVDHAPSGFLRTLEIGAGLGEHLEYERLSQKQLQNYVAIDLRENMVEQIGLKYPAVRAYAQDCQRRLEFPDGHFDRILAIHVLEHLPDLPAAIREMHRLCDKSRGAFSVVIPCEGGLAYSIARKISAQRIFEKRYKQPYKWFIEREHINRPSEIVEELVAYFKVEHTSFFPIPLKLVFCNLCVGMTLRPK